MVKWLVKWKLTQQYWSLPTEERQKVYDRLNAMTKASMDAGRIKDYGVCPDISGGYSILESSETELYEALAKYAPYVSFEATPVISFEKAAEIVKKTRVSATK